MKTFLVTGGAGFIGANLAAALGHAGHATIIVDDFLTGSWENIAGAWARRATPFRGRVIPIDYRRMDDALLRDMDGVFHLAAITDTLVTDDRLVLDVNTTGAARLMEMCVEAGMPLVYASSAAVYGRRERGEALRVGDVLKPLNLYGFSKLALEAEQAQFPCEARIVGLRYFNVFGPGEAHKGRMASMIRQIAEGARSGSVRLFSPGDQARDWIHVDDVVAATIAALEAPRGVYNVGSAHAITFKEVVSLVCDGSPPRIEWTPIPAEIAPRYQPFTLAGEPFVPGWAPPGMRTEDDVRRYAREAVAGQ